MVLQQTSRELIISKLAWRWLRLPCARLAHVGHAGPGCCSLSPTPGLTFVMVKSGLAATWRKNEDPRWTTAFNTRSHVVSMPNQGLLKTHAVQGYLSELTIQGIYAIDVKPPLSLRQPQRERHHPAGNDASNKYPNHDPVGAQEHRCTILIRRPARKQSIVRQYTAAVAQP